MFPSEQAVRSWSTATVPSAMRVEYWLSVVRQSLWPVTEFSGLRSDFGVHLEEAPLGCITSTLETISAHNARRTTLDIARTAEQSYLLFCSLGNAWSIAHNGHSHRLRRGDVVLVGDGEHETDVQSGFHGIILKCPADWVHSWLPDPQLLIGRAILRDSKWGQLLSPVIGQFTPAFAAAAPVPHSVLTDHLGAVLSMIVSETETRAIPELFMKIDNCMRERASESGLTAADVATSVNVPQHTLHYVLRHSRRTFASHLLAVRIDAALSMLSSQELRHLTPEAIGLRAGFGNHSYFARAVRKRTGHLPAQFRSARLGLRH